ncbi:hypothetical protein B0O99DRAFT_685049 [Bisporella sp. PMI_857]|nr:hypothetical protein B0O99DRAFT_685049 [Bisporella sp. PMI_857]
MESIKAAFRRIMRKFRKKKAAPPQKYAPVSRKPCDVGVRRDGIRKGIADLQGKRDKLVAAHFSSRFSKEQRVEEARDIREARNACNEKMNRERLERLESLYKKKDQRKAEEQCMENQIRMVEGQIQTLRWELDSLLRL